MKKPENLLIVIFGASGDLTYRKLMPALYALYNQELMPDKYMVLGVGRTEISNESFRKKIIGGIRKFTEVNHLNDQEIIEFAEHLAYYSMDLNVSDEYIHLKSILFNWVENEGKIDNFLFYLSLTPAVFGIVAKNLAEVGLNKSSNGIRRLIVEKPFGYDLASGIALNHELHVFFDENQIFRIDHYLGKETVQNLFVMRFSNGILEPLWNRNFVHHVEITSAESLGMEGRGSYYDNSGALRDMLQNHLLNLVGFIAMEPPSNMGAEAIRNETLKVLQSLKPIKEEDVDSQIIRGQYVSSHVRGETYQGYREEKGVNPESYTETYVAMKFFIDNWRWNGVPFYIRTGKRLPIMVTEVVVHFKPAPHSLFQKEEFYNECNQLVIRIQPDEGILLKIRMKEPGAGFNLKTVNMDFHYSELSENHLPSAYERLLYDVMIGDSTLYAHSDAVEAAWKFVAPIQRVWATNPRKKIFGYPAGTWGPENADSLIADNPDGWRYPCKNLADDGIYCEL